jgi:ubiquinone/menaquinone biosynthesis C-methylase UbiE
MKFHQRQLGFDRIASIYGLLENISFATALQRARIAHVDQIKNAEEILLAGEGNGRFLKVLLERNPRCRVTCMDKSQEMLKLARKRVGNLNDHRVDFQKVDLVRESLPQNKYDALVTNFFLDCFPFETLSQLLPRLADSMQMGGTWLLADFVEPLDKGILGSFQNSALRLLYYFFSKTSGVEAKKISCPKQILRSLGIQENKRVSILGNWIYSSTFYKTRFVIPSNPAIERSAHHTQKTLTLPR